MFSKNQIVNGLIKYVELEVISKVEDKALQIVLGIGIIALKRNQDLIDSVLKNPFIGYLVKETEDGKYDLDEVFSIIDETLKTYGKLPVTIPAIKFISPNEKTLKFSTEDIAKLKTCIEEGAN